MKIILSVLLACSLAAAEIPPPQSPRAFNPSPQLFRFSQPQQLSSSLAVDLPPKVTIEQLIRLTEQLQGSKLKLPSTSYGTPPRTSYGVPSKQISTYPSQYRPPATELVPNKQILPVHNIPGTLNSQQPQSQYGPPQNRPSNQYGLPNNKNLETFDKVQNNPGQGNLLNGFTTQHLPIQGPADFYSDFGGLGQLQSNPQQIASQPGQNYIPPTTARTPYFATQAPLPISTVASSVPDGGNDNQATESTDADGIDDPNVSVATAVAGGSGLFYVQQPDGRLQRVVFQKTKDINSKPEEYTANYYFQNIHALPNTVYSPLITLGRK
ncbi:uncharacterized protein LOC132698567 isoform X2 [Cylas formicarius]|uniref:uncharacterized protein LOC132698567 isoform X2 n=1 Tax=Cylas formicarius TaxID=197179 RepID=UPI002958D211|nr:uncharacterized protein LOC132698567 isoform X2 [Cylas formicarius]